MAFEACRGCRSRLDCATAFYAGQPRKCTPARRVSDIPRRPPAESGDAEFFKAEALEARTAVTLVEAAEVVIRHWDTYRERGFDAAIRLLTRALERTKA